MKPFKNNQPPTNFFILGTSEMREKLIPYSIADVQTLKLTSCSDLGIFRKFFAQYELSKIEKTLKLLIPPGINMKNMVSITGMSIFNKQARQNYAMKQWDMMYDLAFDGEKAQFDTALPIFVSVIIRYAYYLQTDT
jgi:hypothetical protein